MRIAAISDIHGNLPALESVMGDITARAVDLVVNLGDHVSGPLWPLETIEILMAQSWIQIAGNHDRALAAPPRDAVKPSDAFALARLDERQREWIADLSPAAMIDSRVFLCHGNPASDLGYLLDVVEGGLLRLATEREMRPLLAGIGASLVLCGHSHVPRMAEMPDGVVVVNPGSVGLPAYRDEAPEPHIVECGSSHARYAVIDQRDGGCIVDLIAVPYDSRKAAEQARRNGRRDWAVALESGRVAERA
jgi:putative phosphoesterase